MERDFRDSINFHAAHPTLPSVKVRPHTLSLQNGYTVLATSLDGEIDGMEDHGLYVKDTRYISRYTWSLDEQPFVPVVVQPVDADKSQGYYMTPQEEGYPGQRFHIQINRLVGQGMHEDVIIQNFTPNARHVELKLLIETDFEDIFEVLAHKRQQQGQTTIQWDDSHQSLSCGYQVDGFNFGVVIRFTSDVSAQFEGNSIKWLFNLDIKEKTKLCVNVEPIYNNQHDVPIYRCLGHQRQIIPRELIKQDWLRTSTNIRTLNQKVQRAVTTAKFDLISMRLWEDDPAPNAWIPVAGLPNYVGIFGRDTLTAGWQAALYSPEMMKGTLLVLNRYQADKWDDWRDEQPGKMVHEVRMGPLSLLNKVPQARYYGSTTSTPLYLIVLSEWYHWTGDLHFIEENRPHMDRALAWLERYGDLDGDGLYEYQTRSSQGLKNQGWKDSDEGIVYADGTQVEPPTATCEEQAWVYEAKVRASILYTALKDFKKADSILEEAYKLRQLFDKAFWMPEHGYYALALDADKRQVGSITSNPGHCLVSGIIPEEKADQVIERMFKPDLFSGWGIRTLSINNPSFNPYAYHLGTVWPVENGTFCMAFVRYGEYEKANHLAKAVFDASSYFEYGRLPEAISGYPRNDEHPYPSIYPNSCMPQAWSSSAIPIMIQAMLGLYPFAPLNLLMLDPHLPSWLPQLSLNNLQVGNAKISLDFWRDGEGQTHYQVKQKIGTLRILPQLINIHHFSQLEKTVEKALSR